MRNISFPITGFFGRSLLGHVRLLHKKLEPIVVVAAARTPCGKYQGQLASLGACQLGQMVLEAAVKRSAIPVEQIQHIFMNATDLSQKDEENNVISEDFLKKAKYTLIGENSEMDSFQMAFEFVKSHPQAAAVAGGFVSATKDLKNENLFRVMRDENTENYLKQSLLRYSKACSNAVFDSELVPLKVQKQQGQRRVIEEIFRDEICAENLEDCSRAFQYSDGASAVVLTSLNNAQELKLSPLAVIKGLECSYNTDNILPRSVHCLERLFAKVGIQPYEIKQWEIEDTLPQHVRHLKQHFNINLDLINPHGGTLILGYSPFTAFTRLLIHISHTLDSSEYGCVISNSHRTSSALIIQKLLQTPVPPHRLPLLTLYTKNPCPLCDVLVEELELNFSGEYELEKVFIDTKDNVRFLRLYRYDIPVVFLNNQFLCMHRLNHRLLRKRLNSLKSHNL